MIAQWVDASVQQVATTFVPCEIVTPPIAMDRLRELEPLWRKLREAHAEGTRTSMLHAFGLHMNPELPDPRSETILAYLRAFSLLSDWLIQKSRVDFARRVTPYIDPFPEDYLLVIVDPDYHPDIDQLITDYIEHNPTRNRSLDMLPLFATFRADLIEQCADAHLVKARPTLHYRLPNCELDDPHWSPAVEWNRWIEVERLADDPPRIEQMSREYLALPHLPFRAHASEWIERTASWLGRSSVA
jgi:hypothetical protein